MKLSNQYKLMFYYILAIITGSIGVMFFIWDQPDNDCNFKVIGCILLISFVGHIFSFCDRMKNS